MEPEVRQRFERMEAILEGVLRSQAAAGARMDKHEARADKLEARFEKRMKGFEKLAQIGMKEIAQLRRAQRQTEEKINALIDAQQRTEALQQRTEALQQRTEALQQRTEASLQRFINSLRKGSNGRH